MTRVVICSLACVAACIWYLVLAWSNPDATGRRLWLLYPWPMAAISALALGAMIVITLWPPFQEDPDD